MDRQMEESRGGWCNGFTLKMIAVITMLIDHSAVVLLERMLYYAPVGLYPQIDGNWQQWYQVYIFLRGVGRFAFPIYCFLIVEGFLHTRNVAKYALRLFAFSLISEVPFDLAFRRTWWDFSYNNVFFTLLIGLLVIAAMQAVSEWQAKHCSQGTVKYLSMVLQAVVWAAVVLGGMFVAESVLNTDYGASGVMAIVIFYLLRRYPGIAYAAAIVALGFLSSRLEFVAILGLPFILSYNGARGRQIKYFFYAFYPVHLLVLVGIAYIMGL